MIMHVAFNLLYISWPFWLRLGVTVTSSNSTRRAGRFIRTTSMQSRSRRSGWWFSRALGCLCSERLE